MTNPDHPHVTRGELEASLARLGVAELEERLEVSPLLAAGIEPTAVDRGDICCTCKIRDDLLNEAGNVEYPLPDAELPLPVVPMPTGGFR